MTRRLLRGAAMLAVFLAAALAFLACYRLDNKYTAPEPTGQNGLLTLDEAQLAAHPVLHLTHGWEIFPGALLAPEEITADLPRLVAAIGEYGGFEFGDADKSPHGSATYRLNLLLPETERSYTMELPEIYSSYRLYLNGVLVKEMGEPEPTAYRPFTGNSTLTFSAAGRTEIVIAATDYSHFYSGLVYPPAFGEPDAVMKLLNSRFALRLCFCTLALMAGLYYLTTGFFAAKRNRLSMLYGLLCLCFVGYTAYPIRGTLWPGGMLWYGFENFCYTAMFLLVALIQTRITGTRSRLTEGFFSFGALVCMAALIMPHIVTDNLLAIGGYSALIGLYAWLAAAYLTIGMTRYLLRGGRYGGLMLAGILVFDAALLMDRLLPLHEPILLGWFVELAGAVMVLLIGAIAAQEAVRASRERLVLEGRIDSVTRLVAMQRDYYPVILSGIAQSRALHHDLRHQLRLMRGYLAAGDMDALRQHLDAYEAGLSAAPVSFTRNLVVDTVLRQFAALSAAEQIAFEAHVDVPEKLPVQDGDLAALLGNLLENAVEACAHVAPAERRITASVLHQNGWLYVELRNSFDGYAATQEGRFLSRKRGRREGIGLASVQDIAARYEGEADFAPDARAGLFRSRVALRLLPPQEDLLEQGEHL